MALKTTRWDVTEYLKDEAAIAAYLEAVFEDGDPGLIAAAIGDVAKARGMTQIARESGLSRESLYRALSRDGNPELSTLTKVIRAIGMRIAIEPSTARTNTRRRKKRMPAKKNRRSATRKAA
jgi:probable addiction module antidote protein